MIVEIATTVKCGLPVIAVGSYIPASTLDGVECGVVVGVELFWRPKGKLIFGRKPPMFRCRIAVPDDDWDRVIDELWDVATDCDS